MMMNNKKKFSKKYTESELEKNKTYLGSVNNEKEIISKMTQKIMHGIKDETEADAFSASKEIYNIIKRITECQLALLETRNADFREQIENTDLQEWIKDKLHKIALEHSLNEYALRAVVVDLLNKQHTEFEKTIVNDYNTNFDIDLQGWLPENDGDSIEAKQAIDGLVDSISQMEFCSVCKEILSLKDGVSKSFSDIDDILFNNVIKSKWLSDDEVAFKYYVAIENYINLRNDKDFKGSPVAYAIQGAMSYVTSIKRLVLMQQEWNKVYKRENIGDENVRKLIADEAIFKIEEINQKYAKLESGIVFVINIEWILEKWKNIKKIYNDTPELARGISALLGQNICNAICEALDIESILFKTLSEVVVIPLTVYSCCLLHYGIRKKIFINIVKKSYESIKNATIECSRQSKIIVDKISNGVINTGNAICSAFVKRAKVMKDYYANHFHMKEKDQKIQKKKKNDIQIIQR